MKTMTAMMLALGLLGSAPALAIGAFAVDSEEGQAAGDEGYGIGWGGTRQEAQTAALRECRKAGNDSCRIVAWFETCGAFAANRTSYGVGWGRTRSAAEGMALDNCDGCRVVLSECE